MASRVNTKFVLGLAVVLVALVGVVGYVGIKMMNSGGQQNIDRGDQAMKEGDLKKAINFYGRAVNKDRGNVEWIKKWLAAIEAYTPPNQQGMQDMYAGEYLGALRAMCDAERDSAAPFKRFLGERYQLVQRTDGSLAQWEGFIREYEEVMKLYRGDETGRKQLVRFRGLARASMLERNPDLSEDTVKAGMQDLADALSVDAKDGEVVVGAASFERALGERAERAGRQAEAEKWMAAAKKRIEDALVANPESLRVRLAVLGQRLGESVRKLTPEEKAKLTNLDVLQAHKKTIQEVLDSVMATPPERIEALPTMRVAQFTSLVLEDGPAKADAMLDHVMKAHGKDPLFLFACSAYQLSRQNLDKAEELARAIVAMPDRPVGLEGLLLYELRKQAVRAQVDAEFIRWEKEQTQKAKADLEKNKEKAAAHAAEIEKIIAKLRDLRKDLASRVGESAPVMKSIDGRLLEVEGGKAEQARRLITEYNDATGNSDTQMLMVECRLLLNADMKGAAKSKLERILQVDKTNVFAMRALGRLHFEAREYREAQELLTQASNLMPSDAETAEIAQKARDVYRASLQSGQTAEPNKVQGVTDVIVAVDQLTSGISGDREQGIRMLREALVKFPGDANLSIYLTRLLLQTETAGSKNRDEAKKVLDDAIRVSPKDSRLTSLRDLLDRPQSDPVEAALQTISEAAPEHLKALARWTVYRMAGRPEEASKALADAVRIAPENPNVIDAQFDDALGRVDAKGMPAPDEKGMQAAVDQATRLNTDGAKGNLYKARLLMATGKMADAIGLLRQIVIDDKYNLLAWRLLGIALYDTRQPVAAADALKKAVEIKGDDIPSVNGYVQALVASDQVAEALRFARASEKVAMNNPQFREVFLTLEANAPGGNRQIAIKGRQNLAEEMARLIEKTGSKVSKEIIAAHRSNRAKLAGLYINTSLDDPKRDESFAEADRIIKELRKEDPTDITGVELAAALEGKKGHIPEGVAIMRQFINDTPENKRTEELYINGSHLLVQLGQKAEALAMLEEGRKYQDAKKALIDREIGDQLFTEASRYGPEQLDAKKPPLEQSLAAYQRVIDAGSPDDDLAVRLRMLECCMQLEKWPEMAKIVEKLPQAAQSKATVLLLQAEAAKKQNDRVKALRFYDQAVTAEPKNPICYLKRGDFKLEDTTAYDSVREAEADYDQIVRVDPNSMIGRVRQVQVYRMTGRDELAVAKLKEAIAVAPADKQESLRIALPQMLEEVGKMEEAAQACDDAVKAYPQSLQWRLRSGQQWGKAGNWSKACEYLGSVWRERKDPEYAVAYVEALLNAKDIRNAHNVLTSKDVQDMMAKLANDGPRILPLRLLRARTLAAQGRSADAVEEIRACLPLVREDSLFDATLFMSGVLGVYPQLADQIGILSQLQAQLASKGRQLPGYLTLKMNELRLRDPSFRSAGVTGLQQLTEASKNAPAVEAACWSLLGTVSYDEKKWDEARERFQKGVELDPNNIELRNNLAYVLAVKLNKGEDAKVHALKAARLAPQNSGFLDTLGACYIAVKDWDQASAALSAGLKVARNDMERVPLYVHLAKVRLGQGDKIEARRKLDLAKELANNLPAARQSFGEDIDEVQKAIDSK